MDKSREQFDAWYAASEPNHKEDCLEDRQNRDFLFSVWQASRASIEVELPEKVFVEDDFDSGHNMAIDYCAETITSLGLKVKP